MVQTIVPIQYTYLVGSLLFFLPWTIIFLLRRDLRLEMLLMGTFMAITISVGCYRWCTLDWWQPLTATGTRIGIEDFLFGFAIGGIAAAAFELVFKNNKWIATRTDEGRPVIFFLIVILLFVGMEIFFTYINWSSFIASTVVQALAIVFLVIHYRIPLLQVLTAGSITTIIAMPVYWVMNLLTPGWIESTYYTQTLAGIRFLTIPLEEIVFFFMVGMLLGPLFDVWKGYYHKLRNNE